MLMLFASSISMALSVAELQGEYRSGNYTAWLIATDDNALELQLYQGSWPFKASQQVWQSTLKISNGQLQHGDNLVALASGAFSIKYKDQTLSLTKFVRRSPTLGLPAPKGAKILFTHLDTTSLSQWLDTALSQKGYLREGGTTVDDFQSFDLHLEYRLPLEPSNRGQNRGNSGLYIFKRYEVQILDNFGFEAGFTEAGALYRQKAPDVNAALPPLTWQTLDISFDAPTMGWLGLATGPLTISVYLNGQLVQDQVALSETTGLWNKWRGNAGRGNLYLQDHWHAVEFNNIWLLPK